MLWVKLDLRFFRGSDGDASVTLGVPTTSGLGVSALSRVFLRGRIRTAVRPRTPIKELATATSAKVPRGLSVALSRTTVAVSA